MNEEINRITNKEKRPKIKKNDDCDFAVAS